MPATPAFTLDETLAPTLEEQTTPKVDFAAATTPYAAYAGIDTLHSLLHPRSDEPAETTFIVATQVMELLFGLIRFEWTRVQQALRKDDPATAKSALRRGLDAQDVLVTSWDLLASMDPVEFTSFRSVLGEASGFQSYAYLHLEFLLGNKHERLLRLYEGSPEIHADLSRTLEAPSLYDDALAYLGRRGLDISSPIGAWATVYTDPDHHGLRELAELLMDVAERITRWRQRHLASVKRCMGCKPGTGGSSGLSWLRLAAEQDVFPDLWAVRDVL